MPRKGCQQTPEHRAKIAASQLGKTRAHAHGWTHQGVRFVMDHGRERLEHRVIMEQHLGRALLHNEVVHHRNGNRLDNRVENLQVLTRAAHTTLHDTGKSRKGQTHKKGWTPEQRAKQMEAIRKRPPMSAETRAKISATMKRTRAQHFWNSRPNHETASTSGLENAYRAFCRHT